MVKETVPQEDGGTVKTSIGLPEDLWKEVRKAAIDRGTSAQQLCVEALRKFLEEAKHAA